MSSKAILSKSTFIKGLQYDKHLHKHTSTIDTEAIEEFLSTFTYPLYFMDFESFQPTIPFFDNTKPYQQIPLQYSLHYYQMSKNTEIEHREFLTDAGPVPRIPFIKHLLNDPDDPGQIVLYNKSFEIMIFHAIATDFTKYKADIDELIDRIVDLMVPFQKKWYHTPEMQGSYSIKKVLPVLIPKLSYDGFKVADGGTAFIVYEQLLEESYTIKIQETRKNLLEYCKLDTLAMKEIINKLETI